MFEYDGRKRPPFAVSPGPGQESVWDYPRPPRLEPDAREVIACVGGVELARTQAALRLVETASPPTFYLPASDVVSSRLAPVSGTTVCEWKGVARYWRLALEGSSDEPVAWSYPEPKRAYAAIRDYVAFYPGRVECYVAAERVRPQPGHFYGGWITSELVGPFKGDAGTGGW